MYYEDGFQKPNPFQPDVVVGIDSLLDKKLDALGVMISQFAEGGANGSAELMPEGNAEKQKQRKDQVRKGFEGRDGSIARRFRKEAAQWYSSDKLEGVKHAEAFEICEYGRRPDKAELAKLFPFFDK
jgi:hypothetical protein